eukprot:6491843-Amphidinium_carterae.1
MGIGVRVRSGTSHKAGSRRPSDGRTGGTGYCGTASLYIGMDKLNQVAQIRLPVGVNFGPFNICEALECHPAAQSLFGTHIRDGSAGCLAPRLETTARKGSGRDCPALPATRILDGWGSHDQN